MTGSAWVSDYGDPHDPKDFDFIYPISPLHNVPADKVLPPFLLMTADRTHVKSNADHLANTLNGSSTDDNRVVPLHSFKHAATLQHTLPNNPHPFLIRIDKKAGHGAGKGTEKRYVACFSLSNEVLMECAASKMLRTNGASLPNPWGLRCGTNT